jgi:N-methylhydantoinase A/oxoprolinase/acetone carboxylase beta subunit
MMTSEGSPSPISVRWSPMFLKNKADVEDLLDLYRARAAACEKQHKVFVREFRLKASCHLADPEFAVHTSSGESPEKALKGRRTAYFNGGPSTTPIYDEGQLECGNVVKGPAFIESPHTTILIPPGCKYTVDKYLNGLMEEE